MDWLEASVEVDSEAAEAVAEVLSRYATRHGVAIEAGPDGGSNGPVTVKAYLPADDGLWANKQEIKKAMGHLGHIWPIPQPAFQPIVEQDWTEAWKAKMNVLHIGQRIVVRPSWLDYAPRSGEVVIRLDPGMAFGTGLHPTTQLCLEALERLAQPGMRVLDVGTGTGILAIAAARLGIEHIIGIDNDPVAVEAARENVRINGVQEQVVVKCGTMEAIGGEYDLAVVNILADVIIEMMQKGLTSSVSPGGKIITAGLLVDQAGDVLEAMEKSDLALIDRRQRDDWVCLIAQRA